MATKVNFYENYGDKSARERTELIYLVERVGGDFYVFAPKDNKTNRRPLLPSSGIHVIPLSLGLSR